MQSVFNPKVSIIIPVYNGANFMREAIDSALGQTYGNLEVLVINDGSDDGGATEKIAKSYGDRIRYFTKPNGGVATALNLGIEKMQGEYFSWLSHDDIYLPNKIKAQIDTLCEMKNKNIVLYGGYNLMDESRKVYAVCDFLQSYTQRQLDTPLFNVLRGCANGCTMLIPKKFFDIYGKFDPSLPTTQDYTLWFLMFRQVRVKYVSQIYVSMRQHKQQGSKISPTHIEECNALWISFLKQMTMLEMCRIDGTPKLFFEKTKDFLRLTPYKKAYEYSCERMKTFGCIASPLVTVIIPVYNDVLIVEAVECVLGQTYKNIEIVVVDDGSDDFIAGALQPYLSRIRYVKTKNRGVAAARNLGIRMATGEYIAFLDADDLFLPNKIEKQIEFMNQMNAVFSYTEYRGVDVNFNANVIIKRYEEDLQFPKIIARCTIATPTVMVAKTLLDNRRSGLFDESMDAGEDVCAWIDLASVCKFHCLHEVLTTVRIDENTCAYNIDKLRKGIRNIMCYITEQYDGYDDEIRALILQYAALYNSDSSSQKQFINMHQSVFSLLQKAYISYRDFGLEYTLRKIFRWLRKG